SSPKSSPATTAKITTEPPTSIESRAPWITRLHTSRPTSSVPNQWTALGAARRAFTSRRCGSTRPIVPARIATTRFTATSIAPTSAIFRRTSRRSQSHCPSRGETSTRARSLTAPATWFMGRSPIPDARVEGEIREFHKQVHEGVRQGDQEHDALDHRVVPPEDRRDDETAEPRDIEYRFDHDRAADQDRKRDPDHGERRDDRVLERVLVDDHALVQSLGAARQDELLPQDVEHARSCDPCDQRRLHQSERDGRHEQRSDVGPESLVDGHVARHGDPPKPNPEH